MTQYTAPRAENALVQNYHSLLVVRGDYHVAFADHSENPVCGNCLICGYHRFCRRNGEDSMCGCGVHRCVVVGSGYSDHCSVVAVDIVHCLVVVADIVHCSVVVVDIVHCSVVVGGNGRCLELFLYCRACRRICHPMCIVHVGSTDKFPGAILSIVGRCTVLVCRQCIMVCLFLRLVLCLYLADVYDWRPVLVVVLVLGMRVRSCEVDRIVVVVGCSRSFQVVNICRFGLDLVVVGNHEVAVVVVVLVVVVYV